MDKHDPLRRKILLGTLAGGCVIGVSALTGCRDEPSVEPPPESPDSNGSGKLSQANAEYQNTPNGDEQCSNCEHFIAQSGTCRVVEGQVSPEGWCKLWVRTA